MSAVGTERVTDRADRPLPALRRGPNEHHRNVERMAPQVVDMPPRGVLGLDTRGQQDRCLQRIPSLLVCRVPTYQGQSARVTSRHLYLALLALASASAGCSDAGKVTPNSVIRPTETSVDPRPSESTEGVGATVAHDYRIAGHMLMVGGPVGAGPTPADGEIQVVSSDSGVVIARTDTKADGSFAVSVPAGRYRVVGVTPQYQEGKAECVLEGVAAPGTDTTDLVVACQRK